MFSCCHPRSARRGAGRARSQHPVRLQRGRNRQRVRQHPRGDREADHAGQESARGIEEALRRRGRGRLLRASSSRPPRALLAVQRGLSRRVAPRSAVRAELCQEAMRLTAMLLEHPLGRTPATYALAALMCLHAARLPARIDASGNLSSLFDQDRIAMGPGTGRRRASSSWTFPPQAPNSASITSRPPSRRFTRALFARKTRTGKPSFHSTTR